MDSIAILSGFAVGAIVGMTGVGGGSLMTPLLIGVFKLHPAVAIGTDLWFAALTKTGGAVAHARHGHVEWRITRLLLAGSLPAALATIALMHATGVTKGWAAALTFSLGIALLLTAVVVAFKKTWQALGLKLERWLPESRKAPLTVAEMAKDAIAVIRALGFDKVDLIGFSLGGFVAQDIVLQEPDLATPDREHRAFGRARYTA